MKYRWRKGRFARPEQEENHARLEGIGTADAAKPSPNPQTNILFTLLSVKYFSTINDTEAEDVLP